MRSVLRLSIYPVAAACAALFVSGCGGGGGGGGSTVTSASVGLVGHVISAATGDPVSNATVTLDPGNLSTKTDASGLYRFDGLSATFAGGTVTVTLTNFSTETAPVTSTGAGLQVTTIALNPEGTAVAVSPTAGGTVTQPVAEAPTLPSAELEVPADSLDGTGDAQISLTPVVNQPADELVTTASVQAQAIGDPSTHVPEIEVRINARGRTLKHAVRIRLPLPFPMTPGTTVPLIQLKNGQWIVVGDAVVDDTGLRAKGQILELLPTGVQAWHKLDCTQTELPEATLQEMSMDAIQRNVNNLNDRTYVQDKVLVAGQISRITARFDVVFGSVSFGSTGEEILTLGNGKARAAFGNHLYSGAWAMTVGPVKFKVFQETCKVIRVVPGQPTTEAGTFTVTRGRPNWPRPAAHNQGGIS